MRSSKFLLAVVLFAAVLAVPGVSDADGTQTVGDSASFVTAFNDGTTDEIVMTADINLAVEPMRPAGADPLLLDGGGFTLTAAPTSNVLDSAVGTGDLDLLDITITGSNPMFGFGGGIAWRGGDVTVTNSTITGNDAVGPGGGILLDGGDLTVTNSVFSDNFGPGNGGGVWANSGSISITDSTFTQNVAGNGGAIMANSNSVTLDNTVIFDNEASGGGGGGINTGGSLNATDSTISSNEAGSNGGGVIAGDDSTLIRTTISGNTAGTNGIGGGQAGGLQVTAPLTLINSTISNNTADGSVGGVISTDLTLVYSTIVSNGAPTTANLSTFGADGMTSFGSVVGLPTEGDNCTNLGTVTSNGWNYENGGDTCGFGAGEGDVVNGADPQLAALADNGGATETRLPADASPLVDQIPAASCEDDGASGVTTDQRGVERPQQGECDIGAVEIGAPAPPGPNPPAAPLAPSAARPAVPATTNPSFTG